MTQVAAALDARRCNLAFAAPVRLFAGASVCRCVCLPVRLFAGASV
jgi:hypothetical protein